MKIYVMLISAAVFICSCSQVSEKKNADLSPEKKSDKPKVTPENFIRAETDKMFFAVVSPPSEGINTFYHFRTPTPLDLQRVVRMNKDVLYSSALVDTKNGAKVIFPKMPDKRYASILIIDNDHYCSKVIYEPGEYDIPGDTRYMFMAVRIQLFNPKDSVELAKVNKIQDEFKIIANSAEPFPEPQWDPQSLDSLHKVYEAEYSTYEKIPADWMGPRGTLNEKNRHLACAGAWGLFPNKDAVYINYNGGDLPGNACYEATYKIPAVGAFWSITVYGKDGFMKSENCIINKSNVKYNKDGTFTVHYGPAGTCTTNAKNRLDITDGWNLLMRCYLPKQDVLSGAYKLPDVKKL
jgi:hypothetical protein